MQYGCPVCNGLTEISRDCPVCGQTMTDGGMVENYYGPYSPYDDQDFYELPVFWQQADEMPCVHLLSCPDCGYDSRLAIPQVVMG